MDNEITGQVDDQSQTNDNQPANNKQEVNPAQIRKSTQQSLLKAASTAAGVEFNSMEDLIGMVARLSQQQTNQQTTQQTVQTQPDNGGETAEQRQKRVTANDLQDQLQAMRQQMADQQNQLRQKELDNSIRGAMGDKFDSAFSDYTIGEIKRSLHDQDGEWIVVDSKNRQRYTADGLPMTVQNLIEELGQKNPKLLKQQMTQGGSGLRPQGAFDGFPGDSEMVPDYSRDPAAFNAWASKRGLGKNTGLKSVTASVYNSTSTRKMF
jgi:hypothetical protein